MNSLPFKIDREIHVGNKHIVYRAIPSIGEKDAVFKIPRNSFNPLLSKAKLESEQAILQLFRHPNIVKTLGMQMAGNTWALVLEQANGLNLSRYINGRPLPSDIFFSIAAQLTEALQVLHQKRVIHKNISSSNILFDPESGQITLTGFSLAIEQPREACYADAKEAFEAELAYISPEQTGRMNKPLDQLTDFYSLGIVLYEMLTGAVPFNATDALEMMHFHIAVKPVAPQVLHPGTAPALSGIILKLLEKSPEDRYQSGTGILSDLKKCLAMHNSGISPDFKPGEQDIPDQFRIPNKLYGRKVETAQLELSYQNIEKGHSCMVLVKGYSGVGKSSLVKQVQKLIVERKGFFISGKFDQFKRDIPLSSIALAFSQLIRQLLTGDEQYIETWRNKVAEAVGSAGRAITAIIPELELLTGKQPELLELPSLEANNRFNQIFDRFIKVFCQPEHPLCIFLDDLQWIDSASRQWIENHLSDTNLSYFMLIGAFRENEVAPAHPLMLMIARLKDRNAHIQNIDLLPLTLSDLGEMIGDALHKAPADCIDLSEIVLRKTDGNPFFTRQCLLSLYENGAIYLDTATQAWMYDLNIVEQINISDNVVELMEALISTLPDDVQHTLRFAALIGGRFGSTMLSTLVNRSIDETNAQLLLAVKKGVIVPAQGGLQGSAEEFSFLHDRVQFAALSLLDESERKHIRLKIGRLLLTASRDIWNDENIYEIADHLNDATDLITDPEEIEKLANINFSAGRRANNAAAYETALRYITRATKLQKIIPGQQTPAINKDLLLLKADVEHMCGNNDLAENHYNQALDASIDVLERAAIYQRKIHFYINLRKFEDAYNTGREAVKTVGVNLPAKFVPPLFIKDLITYRILLCRRKIGDIADLPEMTDERLKMAVFLMSTFARAAYQIKPELCVALCTKIVDLCLKNGNTEGGYIGFMALGPIFFGAILKNKQTGFEFGQLTIALVEKYKSSLYKAEAYFVVGYFAMPWRKPATEMEKYWQIAYEAGLVSGDLFHASCACCGTIQSYYMRGKNFDEILEACNRYREFLSRVNNTEAIKTLQAISLSISNLRGETLANSSYSTSTTDEAEYVLSLGTFGSRHFAHYYFINKMQTLYLWGNYDEAYKISVQSATFLKDSPGMLHTAEHHFYKALIICKLFSGTKGIRRVRWRRLLKATRDDFSNFSVGCEANFIHKFQLLDAEIKRVTGRLMEAENLYYASIESSAQYGYLHIKALAHELAANFHYNAGRGQIARIHLKNAQDGYKSWGATAYADFLPQKFPALESLLGSGGFSFDGLPTSARQNTENYTSGMLDLATVFKSSEAISREIRLRDLLSALMVILIENAGAQRIVLLLPAGSTLAVHAEYTSGAGDVQLLPEIPLETYPAISKAIVYYVARTRDVVLLDNAATSGDFINDEYVRNYKPRSVLCTPLVRQGKLTAIIYLENNLAIAAFSQDRVHLLSVLSGQMAISIENAMLYDNLEQKVVERTEELKGKNKELEITLDTLKESQRRLIHAEKMAYLGQMASGIAHEIQNPLNFVINFSGASESLIEEVKELLPQNEEAWVEEMQEVLNDLQLNTEKIAAHGKRASAIIKDLIQQTNNNEEGLQDVNPATLFEQCITRAKSNFAFKSAELPLKIDIQLDENLTMLRCLPGGISTALVNIIDNALYAMQMKRNHLDNDYSPHLMITGAKVGSNAELRIRDNGEGIPAAIFNKIFIPFFTTKPTGRGNTGNGLAQSHQIIVESHHGFIEIVSEPGIFTEVLIVLPAISPSQ